MGLVFKQVSFFSVRYKNNVKEQLPVLDAVQALIHLEVRTVFLVIQALSAQLLEQRQTLAHLAQLVRLQAIQGHRRASRVHSVQLLLSQAQIHPPIVCRALGGLLLFLVRFVHLVLLVLSATGVQFLARTVIQVISL